MNVTGNAPGEEAVTVCVPRLLPNVHNPEVEMPAALVGGAVGSASDPPPLATTYVTTAPMMRFPAASFTFVQSGSGSTDPFTPDWASPE